MLVERSPWKMIKRKEEACMSVQLIPVNLRKGRRFTPQQKLQILKELGTEWQWYSNCREVWDSSPYPLSLAQTIRAKVPDFFQRQASAGRSAYSQRIFSLPMHPYLKEEEQEKNCWNYNWGLITLNRNRMGRTSAEGCRFFSWLRGRIDLQLLSRYGR